MTVLMERIILGDNAVQHLLVDHRTLCGMLIENHKVTILAPHTTKTFPLCGNCDRTNARYTTDRVEPEIDLGATRRGSALAEGGRVREVPGRLFRVAGQTDTYTVVIPSDDDLATICTCMAAKTHPEIMCKHASAVFLSFSMEGSK